MNTNYFRTKRYGIFMESWKFKLIRIDMTWDPDMFKVICICIHIRINCTKSSNIWQSRGAKVRSVKVFFYIRMVSTISREEMIQTCYVCWILFANCKSFGAAPLRWAIVYIVLEKSIREKRIQSLRYIFHNFQDFWI